MGSMKMPLRREESTSHVVSGESWWSGRDPDQGHVELHSPSYHSPAIWLFTLACIWLRLLSINQFQTYLERCLID